MWQLRASKRFIMITIVFILWGGTGEASFVLASSIIKEEYRISSGTVYKDTRLATASDSQAIRQIEINLSDQHTKVRVGVPNPLNKLARTTTQANVNSYSQHQVVGGINGSFFNGDRLPMYLIAKNNRLVNAGIIASGKDQYVNEPIAFGITDGGAAKIDTYNLDLAYSHKGQKYEITSTNKQRSNDNIILYTPEYPGGYTNTNQFGMEIVVTNLPNPLTLEFGKAVKGMVKEIRKYGDGTNTKIPTDGFVLSAHGESMSALKEMMIGDEITLSQNIDLKWQNADFMLAGGPLLVKDGQVSLSMDPNSSRAKERAPRTAVAIDDNGKKVYFITVDGRQSGYSNGMNLSEFASYLKGLGVEYALNLDGGGSTTMVTRSPGDFSTKLINSPSDGSERAVSTTLFAVSTAPAGQPTYINVNRSAEGTLLKGTSITFALDYVLDQYYNPIKILDSQFSLVDSQKLGVVSGHTFTAVKAGEGTLTAKYAQATKDYSMKVVDKLSKLSVSPSSIQLSPNETRKIEVKAFAETGEPVIFHNTLLNWSTLGEIGTITSEGVFTAASSPGKGSIVVSYGSTTVKIPVEVIGDKVLVASFDILSDWEVSSIRGEALISSTPKEHVYEGTGSLRLSYDYTGNIQGTSASYLQPTQEIRLPGQPLKLGMRVFGDGSKHWIRGVVIDGKGTEHTIDFTKEKGLTWNGWNYIEANLSTAWPTPLKLSKIYLAEPYEELKNTGEISFDQLQAVYREQYIEPLFKDVLPSYWATNEVKNLVNTGIISGYPNGDFKPNVPLNRVQAAILLSRALNLNTAVVENPNYNDIPSSYRFYGEIAAVANAGYMNGKQGGEIFDPNSSLTRAEMAVVLQRAFTLNSTSSENYFSDNVESSFAYDAINALAENDITTGYSDGTYRPANPLSRTEYSVFLYRVLNK